MRIPFVLASLRLLVACGGNDSPSLDAPTGNHPEPVVLQGGGIGGGAIDGVVNLYVIDDQTRQPVAGAAVKVGAVDGTTDATGLFVAAGVTGKQDVIVTASGYRSEVWLGANGANMTMDLQAATPTVGQATLSGAITGFQNIPVPAGHAKLALVTYSQDDRLADAANNLKTPSDGNVCVGITTAAACNFSVVSRTGKVSLVALIFDRDLKGTPNDPSDDTQVLVGYASRTGLTVADGVAQTGQDLAILPNAMTTTESVDFGTPPSGLTAALGLVGIELADGSGVLQLPVTAPGATSALVPKLAAFSGAMYRFSGIAQNAATPPTQSFVLRRHQTGSALAAGTWTAPPTDVSITRTHAMWTASPGATLHSLAFTSGATGIVNITSFDGTSSFDLPAAIALPSGTLTATVQALSAPGLDLTSFALDTDREKLTGAASQPAQVD